MQSLLGCAIEIDNDDAAEHQTLPATARQYSVVHRTPGPLRASGDAQRWYLSHLDATCSASTMRTVPDFDRITIDCVVMVGPE